jgi:multidrug resistance efflux pump
MSTHKESIDRIVAFSADLNALVDDNANQRALNAEYARQVASLRQEIFQLRKDRDRADALYQQLEAKIADIQRVVGRPITAPAPGNISESLTRIGAETLQNDAGAMRAGEPYGREQFQ